MNKLSFNQLRPQHVFGEEEESFSPETDPTEIDGFLGGPLAIIPLESVRLYYQRKCPYDLIRIEFLVSTELKYRNSSAAKLIAFLEVDFDYAFREHLHYFSKSARWRNLTDGSVVIVGVVDTFLFQIESYDGNSVDKVALTECISAWDIEYIYYQDKEIQSKFGTVDAIVYAYLRGMLNYLFDVSFKMEINAGLV